MLNFKQYVLEDYTPVAQHEHGPEEIDLQHESVRAKINQELAQVTSGCFQTQYIALEHVRKVLAVHHITLPKYIFHDNESDLLVTEIRQFGKVIDFEATPEPQPFFLYFEYVMESYGEYKVFCEVVTEDELEELAEDESEGEEELAEESSFAVEIEGMPKFYVADASASAVIAHLRKLLKNVKAIKGVARTTTTEIKKQFRIAANEKNPIKEEKANSLDHFKELAAKKGYTVKKITSSTGTITGHKAIDKKGNIKGKLYSNQKGEIDESKKLSGLEKLKRAYKNTTGKSLDDGDKKIKDAVSNLKKLGKDYEKVTK